MKIVIEPHTLLRAAERGANENEINDVIHKGFAITAKQNRFGKAKIFDFNAFWNNKYFDQKRVEVIYTIEDDIIVTITVYVFYGKWELK